MPRPFFLLGKHMIRIKDIQEALSGLVGWRRPYDPRDAIDPALEESASGLYYQDAHPLLTLENMKAVMPDTWDFQYGEWNLARSYRKGDKARHGGIVWIALQDNAGQEPSASDFNGDYNGDFGDPYWKPYNTLSDFLSRLTVGGIAAVVQTFLQSKQLAGETRELVERRAFFDGAGRIRATIQNTHKVVGFEITPVRAMGVTAKIERVGLQMFGASGTVRLYLFHSSQPEPLRTFDLGFTNPGGGFQWFDLQDCHMPYVSGGNNPGGSWYLCYSQDSLPFGMEAVNMSKDWSREPCGTCNPGSLAAWRELTKYLQVSPFMAHAPGSFSDNPRLWDISGNIYTNTTSYGLNCVVSVGCDLTDFIISQKAAFATVLQRQVAATALRTLALNPSVRVNRNQSNATRDDLLYELDGAAQGRPAGINYQLAQAYKALAIDTAGIDRVCLKCNNHGVRYGTA